MIVGFKVTSASVHDSRAFVVLIDEATKTYGRTVPT